MENKITVEITAEGWKTDVTINEKTYTERREGEYNCATRVEGNFEEEKGIPDCIYDSLASLDCFDCQQALYKLKNEEGDK